MNRDVTSVFTWHFLDDVGLWTLGLTAFGVIGAVIAGRLSLAIAWVITAALDVALVHLAARRGGSHAAEGLLDRSALAIFVAARLGLKVGLIVAAAFIPNFLDFWGTVIGALSYDTVLMVVGSVMAARRTVGSGR